MKLSDSCSCEGWPLVHVRRSPWRIALLGRCCWCHLVSDHFAFRHSHSNGSCALKPTAATEEGTARSACEAGHSRKHAFSGELEILVTAALAGSSHWFLSKVPSGDCAAEPPLLAPLVSMPFAFRFFHPRWQCFALPRDSPLPPTTATGEGIAQLPHATGHSRKHLFRRT